MDEQLKIDEQGRLINSWIFEYFLHQFVKNYFRDGSDEVFLHDSINSIVSSMTDSNPERGPKEYYFYLLQLLLCLECGLEDNDGEIDCAFIGDAVFHDSVTQCIALSSAATQNEKTRTMAKQCLIQSHVVIFKYCKRKDSGWTKALDVFHDFMDMLDSDVECKELYEKCAATTRIDPGEDFISEYIQLLRNLLSALFSEFDEPDLIKFARLKDSDGIADKRQPDQNCRRSPVKRRRSIETETENVQVEGATNKMTKELQVLLKDRRPSRKSDIEEIRLEEVGISKLRKKFKHSDNKDRHLKFHNIQKRMKEFQRPPSHQIARIGPWMPEEERLFIEKTLEIGHGKWVQIKEALSTPRSSQQLKDKWRQIKSFEIDETKQYMANVKGISATETSRKKGRKKK